MHGAADGLSSAAPVLSDSCPDLRGRNRWSTGRISYRNVQRTGARRLLALISSGLTIIYGTLGVLNLAHGAMFMLGGYAGYVAFSYTGSFIVAVIAGSLFVMVVGIVMERVMIRHFYDRPHEDQLLVTFGLGIVFVEAVRFVFGSQSNWCRRPAAGRHHLARLHALSDLPACRGGHRRRRADGAVLVLYRTRIGMIVRAGSRTPPWSMPSASTSIGSS